MAVNGALYFGTQIGQARALAPLQDRSSPVILFGSGSTMRYALQFIRAPRPYGVDEGDMPWEPVAGHDDYTDESEAWAACAEFDAAFDHMYIHRVKPSNDT